VGDGMSAEIVELPDEYRGDTDMVAVRHEEDALCWLWAYPSLLPWRAPIVWLYTPVVGKARWPGDLWGVDRHGDLLIVECKQCRRADDPFKDFLAFHYDDRDELKAAHWERKFRKHLKAELAFPDMISERPPNRTDGILPRSNKRSHIRRWPALVEQIEVRIRSTKYETVALSYLGERAKADNPRPYYVALMIVSDAGRPLLSEGAICSKVELERMVGTEHVVVVAIQADRLPQNRARIIARRV